MRRIPSEYVRWTQAPLIHCLASVIHAHLLGFSRFGRKRLNLSQNLSSIAANKHGEKPGILLVKSDGAFDPSAGIIVRASHAFTIKGISTCVGGGNF